VITDLDALFRERLLIPTGVRGVYGLAQAFEEVVERFDAYATRIGADAQPEVLRFPPLLPRRNYVHTDHLETFPNLMGSVHSFIGDERGSLQLAGKKAAGEDWAADLSPTEVMLTPAACYPLYPTATGTLPEHGRIVDLRSFVFRHEPSDDPVRLQMFRMREYVRIGTPEQALAHRNHWLRRAEEMLRALGLEVRPVLANDPFFGRGARVMAATQREQELKYELVLPVTSEEKPTALASCNYHLDHFGHAFDIHTADGAVAHSACVGFGLERVALALFRTHGFSTARWPSAVREMLAL
jgi:seryl-tRNA synthetase